MVSFKKTIATILSLAMIITMFAGLGMVGVSAAGGTVVPAGDSVYDFTKLTTTTLAPGTAGFEGFSGTVSYAASSTKSYVQLDKAKTDSLSFVVEGVWSGTFSSSHSNNAKGLVIIAPDGTKYGTAGDPLKLTNMVPGTYKIEPNAIKQVLNNGTGGTVEVGANHGYLSAVSITVQSSNPPADVTNLAATAGDTQVALSWTASQLASSYEIYVDDSATPIEIDPTTQYTVGDLTNDVLHTFKVVAVNSAGKSAGVTVSATPKEPTDPPGAFTLTATAGNKKANLSWTASAFAVTYDVKRDGTTIATGLTARTFADSGLTNGTTYNYEVVAHNKNGTTSSTASATPVEPAPSSVGIIEQTGWLESAIIRWVNNASVEKYNLYVKKVGTSDYVPVDEQLTRLYGTYYRADIVGLAAGDYVVKIASVIDGAETGFVETDPITVLPHERSGFAFDPRSPHKTGSGGYNDDGTPATGATIIYIDKDNINTVELDVITNSKGGTTHEVGLVNIMAGRQKGYDKRPLILRFVGMINSSDVTGLNSSGYVQVKSCFNITLEGIGSDTIVNGWSFLLREASNVEVRNFGVKAFTDDGISLDTDNTNVWVHNNDIFYGKNKGGDQEKGDGSLDVKAFSNFVTLSYNHFVDSGKCSLCGMGDSAEFFVTYHHNWFDHSDSRHPRIRVGTIHVYNNYFDGISKYGVGMTSGGSAFVENNFFRNAKHVVLTSKQGTDALGDGTFSGEPGGIIKMFGNHIEGTQTVPVIDAKVAGNNSDAYIAESRNEQVPASITAVAGGTKYNNFDTAANMYSYTADAVEQVPAKVMNYAGRAQGGDFSFQFDNAVDDSSYAINKALETKLGAYKTAVVSTYTVPGRAYPATGDGPIPTTPPTVGPIPTATATAEPLPTLDPTATPDPDQPTATPSPTTVPDQIENWDFNGITAGTTYADGDKIANANSAEIRVDLKSVGGTATITQKTAGDNFIKFVDAGANGDGWSYEPTSAINGDTVTIAGDFMSADAAKDTVLLRVFDKNNASVDNTYTTATDGRVFEVKTGAGILVFSDYFSKGSSDTKGLDTNVPGATLAANTWISLKLEYTKSDNKVKVYTKASTATEYILNTTIALGSGVKKVDTIPQLAPTRVSTATRGSATDNLSVDNISIGVKGAGPVPSPSVTTATPGPSITPEPPIPTPTIHPGEYYIDSASFVDGVLVAHVRSNTVNRPGKLIAASYSADGILTDLESVDVDYGDKDYTVPRITEPVDGYVKLFIWNSFNTMYPYSDPYTVGNPPSPAPTAAPTAYPMEAVTASTKWTFSRAAMSSLGTMSSDGKTLTITELKSYNKLNLFAAGEEKDIDVDASNKTIGGESFTERLKLNGTGSVSAPRHVAFLPQSAGTVTIAFAHSSATGDARTLVVSQNGVEQTKTVAPDGVDVLAATVEAGSPVYIYSQTSALNLYQVNYTTQAAPPTAPPTKDPDATPDPTVDPTGVLWKAGASITAGQELIPGLTPLEAMAYTVYEGGKEIDGVTFDGKCLGTTNAPKDGKTGSSLKFVAPSNGVLIVYYKVNTGKAYTVTDSAGTEVAKYANNSGASEYVGTPVSVTAGETYYCYVYGSKTEYFGAKFISNATPPTLPPSATPKPTVDPTQPTATPEPVGEHKTHNFTTQGITSDFITFSARANLTTGYGSVTYKGEMLSKGLKMETETTFSFTAEKSGQCTLVFQTTKGFASVTKWNIYMNDTKMTADGETGLLTFPITAGTQYNFRKADASYVFYIDLLFN